MKRMRFISDEKTAKIYPILRVILTVLTLGMILVLFYSVFFERKYHLNRKFLLYLLRENKIKLIYKKCLYHYLIKYQFEYNSETYFIWYSADIDKFTLSCNSNKDYNLIRSYAPDLNEEALCDRIIIYFI